MKKFRFAVEITEALGTQTFEVEANSADEAFAKLKAGKGDIVEEEVEVQGLNWNSATLVEERE